MQPSQHAVKLGIYEIDSNIRKKLGEPRRITSMEHRTGTRNPLLIMIDEDFVHECPLLNFLGHRALQPEQKGKPFALFFVFKSVAHLKKSHSLRAPIQLRELIWVATCANGRSGNKHIDEIKSDRRRLLQIYNAADDGAERATLRNVANAIPRVPKY